MMASIHHKHALLVKDFLYNGYGDKLDLLDHCVAEQVVCHNFPEFNPTSREEFKAFFRYMADAINQMHFKIEHILADEQTVKVHFHISGVHHEEFMGFPASGKKIDFHGMAIYRLEADMIVEAWMYSGEVVFSVDDGSRYYRSEGYRLNHAGTEFAASKKMMFCPEVVSV
jgi:predicted ester cyclase